MEVIFTQPNVNLMSFDDLPLGFVQIVGSSCPHDNQTPKTMRQMCRGNSHVMHGDCVLVSILSVPELNLNRIHVFGAILSHLLHNPSSASPARSARSRVSDVNSAGPSHSLRGKAIDLLTVLLKGSFESTTRSCSSCSEIP